MPRTVILGSARTPVGKLGGGLSSLHPTDLGGGAKIAWAIFLLFPIVPIVYVLTGGDLW